MAEADKENDGFNMMARFLSCAVAAIAVETAVAGAYDWPQWQGPDRNAVSRERGLLQEWPKDGPPLAWKINGLGGGDSAPSISAGRIFGMGNRGGDEIVWARAEKDGRELWVSRLAPAFSQSWPQSREGPGCTPTVDGDKLYVLGLAGNLACLHVADGKLVWQRDLVKEFGGRIPTWSYRESPLVDGEKVICTPGGDEATMVALNKLTGETIWKTRAPERAGAESQTRGAPGNRPEAMQSDPVLATLDADRNKEISAQEVKAAPKALASLDKNGDSKLSEEEVTAPRSDREDPERSQRRRRFSAMRMMKLTAALDADENREIDESEIKNAVAVLLKLDANSDGKLTQDEVGPRFGAPQNSGAAYASAIGIDFGGVRQYVQLTSTTVLGVRASDGKVLWNYDKPANTHRIACSTPLYHDGRVFAASAYGAGGGLAKLSRGPDGGIAAEEVWFSKFMENHHGGVVLYEGALYGANGGNGGGYLACLDFKTGEVLWNEGEPSKRRVAKGSLALADGRIYYRTEEGPVLLIEPNRREYLERGRFEQPDRTDKPAWGHPVIANGKLYLRDQDTLFCYDVKARDL